MNLELKTVNPAALNDPAFKELVSQGVRLISHMLEAHTKGQEDARRGEVNAYQPPRSCSLPEWMSDEWRAVVACYNAGWDAVRCAPGSTLAKE